MKLDELIAASLLGAFYAIMGQVIVGSAIIRVLLDSRASLLEFE